MPPLAARRPGHLDTCMDGAPLTENKNPGGNIPSSPAWPRAMPTGQYICFLTEVEEGLPGKEILIRIITSHGLATTKLCSSFREKGHFKVHWYLTRWRKQGLLIRGVICSTVLPFRPVKIIFQNRKATIAQHLERGSCKISILNNQSQTQSQAHHGVNCPLNSACVLRQAY